LELFVEGELVAFEVEGDGAIGVQRRQERVVVDLDLADVIGQIGCAGDARARRKWLASPAGRCGDPVIEAGDDRVDAVGQTRRRDDGAGFCYRAGPG